MSGTTNFSSFTNYKQTVITITGDLKKLREYSERLHLEGSAAAISEVLNRLESENFSVAIIGEFKRGKSTLINALLGKDVLPTDVLPTTATLNKITYSVTPFVKLEYKDGHSEEIGTDQLNDYVTKLTDESAERARLIKEATVYYPVSYCQNGVTIIDTPGLNDDEAMTEVTLSVLPHIDAALMVVMAQSPFSESERDFLEHRVITSDLGRVLFVVTGIDLLDEDDVDRVLDNITTRIQKHVLAKAESTFGKDSPEYAAYLRKLGQIRVFGVSAKKALKAKRTGDQEMLEHSCFPVFQAELERFLTEDRGAVMLNVPINRVKSAAMELISAVQLRENALMMEKAEFDRKYQQAMDEIEVIRAQRQEEFGRINESAQTTYDQLLPAIREFWPSLEDAVDACIDKFPLTAEDLKDMNLKGTQERMTKAVRNTITAQSQLLTERIQGAINLALESEAQRLNDYERGFFEATEHLQGLFSMDGEKKDALVGGAVAGLVAAFGGGFLGVGGIYAGYKQAGWKGALLGGGASAATFMGSVMGINLLLGALALPLAWPVALVGTIGVALFSTFAGEKAVAQFFSGSPGKLDSVKKSFQASIHKELGRMKAENNFADDVWHQIEEAFDALKQKIRSETETILSDTQNQLTQLKVDLAHSEAVSQREEAELREMLGSIGEICGRSEELGNQLISVLNR